MKWLAHTFEHTFRFGVPMLEYHFSTKVQHPRLDDCLSNPLDSIHCLVAIVGRGPKPCEDRCCSFVYLCHLLDLLALFKIVILIDTNYIDPESYRLVPLELTQRFVKIDNDISRLAIDEDALELMNCPTCMTKQCTEVYQPN